MTDYRVALDVYDGPLDLLLFLIRREEVDIYDIPIARITAQYLAYAELLEQINPDAVSEFLVLAATLMEIKSRTLLPTPPPEETDGEPIDPRVELVRQLLAYKTFKDAAGTLGESATLQALRYPRDPAIAESPPDELELENLVIWDLFEAFNRMLEQTGMRDATHEVEIDDTPVALLAADIADSLERADGTQPFEDIFTGRSRGEMIALFLALLEMIREHRIRVSQDEPLGPIYIHLLDSSPLNGASERAWVEGNLAESNAQAGHADETEHGDRIAAADATDDATDVADDVEDEVEDDDETEEADETEDADETERATESEDGHVNEPAPDPRNVDRDAHNADPSEMSSDGGKP